MAQSTLSARERILETADRLFCRDGYRATGIDKIIAESGVAKMSLYRHFGSKDDLIVAFLEQRHVSWMGWFVDTVEKHLAKRAELSVIADALSEWFSEDTYRGCSFLNIVAEAGSTGDPRHLKQARAHKAAVEAYVVSLAERLGLQTPNEVGADAALCIEGMTVRYQVSHDPAVVESGRRVLSLIELAATPVKRKKKAA